MSMNMNEMETILKYFMSTLSEDQLSELDDMLVPEKGTDPGAAMDARPAPHGFKMSAWIRKGPDGRILARDARKAKLAQDGKAREGLHERFPNLSRLRG